MEIHGYGCEDNARWVISWRRGTRKNGEIHVIDEVKRTWTYVKGALGKILDWVETNRRI